MAGREGGRKRRLLSRNRFRVLYANDARSPLYPRVRRSPHRLDRQPKPAIGRDHALTPSGMIHTGHTGQATCIGGKFAYPLCTPVASASILCFCSAARALASLASSKDLALGRRESKTSLISSSESLESVCVFMQRSYDLLASSPRQIGRSRSLRPHPRRRK